MDYLLWKDTESGFNLVYLNQNLLMKYVITMPSILYTKPFIAGPLSGSLLYSIHVALLYGTGTYIPSLEVSLAWLRIIGFYAFSHDLKLG